MQVLKALVGSKTHRIAVRIGISVWFSVPRFILVTFCQFLFSTSFQVSCLGDYMLHPNVLHLCLIFLSVPRAFELCFPSEPHHRHDCVIAPVSFPCVIFVNFVLIFGTLCLHCLSISVPSIPLDLILNFCSPYLFSLHKFIHFVAPLLPFFFSLDLLKQKIRIATALCRGMLLRPTQVWKRAATRHHRFPIGGPANCSSG